MWNSSGTKYWSQNLFGFGGVTDKEKIVIAQYCVVSAQKELSLAGLAKAHFLMTVTDGGGAADAWVPAL